MSDTVDQRVENLEGRFRRGLIIVATVVLVSAVGLALTVSVVRRMDDRDKKEDARDAIDDREKAQRDAVADDQRAHLLELVESQHECSSPARPGQHDPEPEPHVHECWDEAAGALLKGQQDQLDTLLRSAKNTETVVNFLNSPARARATADALASIRRGQEEVLSRTTFVVTNPNRPGEQPLTVRPIVGPSPTCPPPVLGVGDVELRICP